MSEPSGIEPFLFSEFIDLYDFFDFFHAFRSDPIFKNFQSYKKAPQFWKLKLLFLKTELNSLVTPSLTASACEVFTCLTIIVLYSSSLPPDSFHLRYITDASTLAEIYEMKNDLEFLKIIGQKNNFISTYDVICTPQFQ